MRFPSSSCLLVLLGLFPGAALAGCFGRTTLEVGSNRGASTAPEPEPDAGSPAPAEDGGPADSPVIAAAKAACTSGEHGPLDPFVTVQDVRDRLEGAWYFCSTSGPDSQEDTMTSIEYAPDDHWYLLEPDGKGGLRRSQGIDREGTYTVSGPSNDWTDGAPDAASQGFVGRMQGSGGFPDFVQFEKGPRRMKITVGTAAWEEWFVYLGPTAPGGGQ